MAIIRNELSISKSAIAGGILFAFVLASCSRTTPEESAAVEPSAAQPEVSVEVATAEVTALQPMLDLVGVVVAIPEKTAVISPQLGGWVSKLDVVEGQSVGVDERLVELDPRSAEVAIARAEATVAEKAAAVKRLQSGYLPEEIAGARRMLAMRRRQSMGLRTNFAH